MTALIFFISVSGCSPVTNPAPITSTPISVPSPVATTSPYIARLILEPDKSLQTLIDVGSGNFIHRYGGPGEALEPVSQMNIETLSPTTGRVSIDLDLWEPENDNDDPSVFDQTGFHDTAGSSVNSTFEFLREFSKMGPEQVLIASVWHVPGWMVENPEDEASLIIPPEKVPEAIESIAAWIIHARDVYGVEIEYVSFNEANLGVKVFLTSGSYISLIQQAGKRFQELGIETKWLLADASNIGETLSYAKAIYSEPKIRQFLGPLSYHSWDYTAGDNSLKAIAQFADENDLEVWCTEGGWNPSLWQTPKEFPTFTNALNQAIIYTRLIKLTRATRLLYWEMVGGDYSLNDGSTPYPILSFLSEFKKQFPPGAQVINTSEDPGNLKFVAAKSFDGFALLIVNRQPLKEKAKIEGLPLGMYTLIRSTRTETNRPLWSQEITDETLELVIAPYSINFLTTLKP